MRTRLLQFLIWRGLNDVLLWVIFLFFLQSTFILFFRCLNLFSNIFRNLSCILLLKILIFLILVQLLFHLFLFSFRRLIATALIGSSILTSMISSVNEFLLEWVINHFGELALSLWASWKERMGFFDIKISIFQHLVNFFAIELAQVELIGLMVAIHHDSTCEGGFW